MESGTSAVHILNTFKRRQDIGSLPFIVLPSGYIAIVLGGKKLYHPFSYDFSYSTV